MDEILDLSSRSASPGRLEAPELRSTLAELIEFGEVLGSEDLLQDLRAARERLLADRFNLVVLGEFKRGKSTLVNALLGREVLPTGVLPLTSVVTIVGAGDRDRTLVRFADGSRREGSLADLRGYVTEEGNPANRLGVEAVRVELAHELLRAGLDLVDTPGVGSIHQHNTTAARDFLAQIDAAVFVLDAGQPFTATERDLAREVAARVPRVLLVLNKIDQLVAEDQRTAVEFVEQAAGELLGCEPEAVFAVSARTGAGLARLRKRLLRLAGKERTSTLTRSLGNVAIATAAELTAAAKLERRALELPLHDLRGRIEVVTQRISELREAREEAAILLEQGARRTLAEQLNQPLETWAARHGERLCTALRAHASELDRLPARELAAELSSWVDERIRAEFTALVAEFEPALAGQLASLQDDYAARIHTILDDVHALAADVFETGETGSMPRLAMPEKSRFSFKLNDPESGLEMIVARLRTLVPGRLGRRLLLVDAERHLLAMADRHAGRLRSELHECALEATRSYRRELAASVDRAIRAINLALDRAADQHLHSEAAARARLVELSEIADRCELIVQRGGFG